MPNQLEEFGVLLNCFVHERKHKMVKRYPDDVKNTISFDETVLSEVICQQFVELSRPSYFKLDVGLIQPHKAHKKIQKFILENFGVDSHLVMSSRVARV